MSSCVCVWFYLNLACAFALSAQHQTEELCGYGHLELGGRLSTTAMAGQLAQGLAADIAI